MPQSWNWAMVALITVASVENLHAQYGYERIARATQQVVSEAAPLPQQTIIPAPAPNGITPINQPLESSTAFHPTTLAELESIALANNPTLVQGAAHINAARGKFIQGGLYPNPEVGYGSDEIGNQGHAGQQGAFIGQKIITAGKLRLNQATASHEISQAQWAYQTQRQRVLNDVRAGYYELLVARRSVELHQQLLRIGQEGLKVAETLLEAKEVSRVDTLQAKIEAESIIIELQNAQNRSRAACRRLAAVLGVPDLDLSFVQGELYGQIPAITWEDSLRRLLSESPELAQAFAGVERARCALTREYAGRVPDVDTALSLKYDNATGSTIAGVTLGLPLPVFNRNQGNISRAHADLLAAENEVRRVELQLQNRLASVYQRYENARRQAEKYAQSPLPSAKQSLDLLIAGYRQGEFPYLDLLTAQRTYFRINLAYLESLRDLQASNIAIEGLLLSGGLDGNGSSSRQGATGE